MIIALEGGICSGKTTLAKQLEKRVFFTFPNTWILLPLKSKKN